MPNKVEDEGRKKKMKAGNRKEGRRGMYPSRRRWPLQSFFTSHIGVTLTLLASILTCFFLRCRHSWSGLLSLKRCMPFLSQGGGRHGEELDKEELEAEAKEEERWTRWRRRGKRRRRRMSSRWRRRRREGGSRSRRSRSRSTRSRRGAGLHLLLFLVLPLAPAPAPPAHSPPAPCPPRKRQEEEEKEVDMAIIFLPKHCAKHDHFDTPITHMLNESSIRSEQGLSSAGAENEARQVQRGEEHAFPDGDFIPS